MKELLDKVLVFKNEDGSVSMARFVKDAMLIEVTFKDGSKKTMTQEFYDRYIPPSLKQGAATSPAETEQEFMDRETARINPFSAAMFVDVETLPDDKKRDKWIIGEDGKLGIDDKIETKIEKQEKLVTSLKAKLLALGITEDEVSILL